MYKQTDHFVKDNERVVTFHHPGWSTWPQLEFDDARALLADCGLDDLSRIDLYNHSSCGWVSAGPRHILTLSNSARFLLRLRDDTCFGLE